MNTPTNIGTPYFSFTFLSEYTHDYLAVPSDFDRRLRDLLSNFDNKGFLNNTLLMIYGDHGNRLTPFSYNTQIGKFERNRQFVGIKLPNRFENTPYKNNFVKNQDKLATFFDVYQTLRQFLHMNEFNLNVSTNCRQQFKKNLHQSRNLRGVSLFEELPERTCMEALIPVKYCSCTPEEDISERVFSKQTGNSTFETAAGIVVAHINEKIIGESSGLKKKCATFKLDKLISIKQLRTKTAIKYKCAVALSPGEGLFEAVLGIKKGNYNQKSLVLIAPPERLNSYGSQSKCIDDSFEKKFCFCK